MRAPLCGAKGGLAWHRQVLYWLRVSGVAGLASATDQEKTQGLPRRGDDFGSEVRILSFRRRAESRRDLRRHNSAPDAWLALTEVA